jgi:hypothetical protein
LSEIETLSENKIGCSLYDIPILGFVYYSNLQLVSAWRLMIRKLDALDAFDDWWTNLVENSTSTVGTLHTW